MKHKTLIAHCEKEYPIYLGSQLLDEADFRKNKLILIMDSNVAKIYENLFVESLGFEVLECLVVPAGEKSKTREMKQSLEDKLLTKSYGRDIMLVAIGGGMICDLVGFLGATYYRGVPVVYWPTSLLAMVDASIGGKTAVNTPYGKNLIGIFAAPFSVWIDVSLLNTLPPKEFSNGMAEVIKHALVYDKALYKQLQKQASALLDKKESLLLEVIERSCEIKNEIVAQDFYDMGVRSILNFGHTIGHAIEILEDYQLRHGEAIAIGMVIEAYISHIKGIADMSLTETCLEIFKLYHLPLKTSVLQDGHAVLNCLYRDKKNKHQEIHMILLKDVGEVYLDQGFYTHPVSEEEILTALAWAGEIF